MKYKFFLSLIAAVLLITGCETKEEDINSVVSESQAAVEQKAPEITLVNSLDEQKIKITYENEKIAFDGYQGKVILVNFFATWCPPCKAEIPHLIKLQEKFKEQFQIIAVLLEENKANEELNSFINYHDINYIVTNSRANFELSMMLGGIKSIPTMVMYDKNGNYFTHYVGAAPEEMIEADIKKALEVK